MKIPIYHYKSKCWSCKKEIDFYYPESLASKYSLGTIKEAYSKTQGRITIRNICPHCNSYQENCFVWKQFLDICNDSNLRDSCIWVEGNLKCKECGEDIDYVIDMEKPSDIIDFFSGYWGDKCLSCMNEERVESLVKKLYKMSRCAVCDRLIFDDQDFYDSITFGDTSIIRSKLNKHHINYEKNEIIIVCSECHTKIHNSNKKKYKDYRPVD
jgi:uncharacterized protein (UPF0212 family)